MISTRHLDGGGKRADLRHSWLRYLSVASRIVNVTVLLLDGRRERPWTSSGISSLQLTNRGQFIANTNGCESMLYTRAYRASFETTVVHMPSKVSMDRHVRTREAPLMNTDHYIQNHNGVNLSNQLNINGYNKCSIRRIINQNNYNTRKTLSLVNEATPIDDSPLSNVPLWRLITGNRHRLPLRIRIALRTPGFSSMILRKDFDLQVRSDGLLILSTNQNIELIYYLIPAVHTQFNFVNVQMVFNHDTLRSHARVHRYQSSSQHWSYSKFPHRIDCLSGEISLYTGNLISVNGLANASAYSWVADYCCRSSCYFPQGFAWLGDTPIEMRPKGSPDGATPTPTVKYACMHTNATTKSHSNHSAWLGLQGAIARTKTDKIFFVRLNFSLLHDRLRFIALGYRKACSTIHWFTPPMLACSPPHLVARMETRLARGFLSFKQTRASPCLTENTHAHPACFLCSYNKSCHNMPRVPRRRQVFEVEGNECQAPVESHEGSLEIGERTGHKKPPAEKTRSIRACQRANSPQEGNGKPMQQCVPPVEHDQVVTTAPDNAFHNTRGAHCALGSTLRKSDATFAREALRQAAGLHPPSSFPPHPFCMGTGHPESCALLFKTSKHRNSNTWMFYFVPKWVTIHGLLSRAYFLFPANIDFICMFSIRIEVINNRFYKELLTIVPPLSAFTPHSHPHRGTEAAHSQVIGNAHGLHNPHAPFPFSFDLFRVGLTNTHSSVSFITQYFEQHVSNNTST